MKTIFTLLFFVLFISQCYCAIELLDFDGELKGEYSTIQEAVNAISEAGDQVVIPGGHYYEVVDVSNKDFGTEDKPIIIKAKDSETVIIDGAYQPLTESGNGLWENSDVFGSGYYMADFSEKECPSSYMVYGTNDDQLLLWTYGTEENMEEFFAGQGVYYDSTTDYVHIKLKDDEDPNDVELYLNCYWTFHVSTATYLTIENLEFRNGQRTVLLDRCTNCVLKGSTINGYNTGLRLRYAESNNVLIEKNVVKQSRDPEWWWSDVKSISPKTMESTAITLDAGDDNKIANNEIIGWFNGVAYSVDDAELNNNLKIYGNKIHEIYDDAIEPEGYCTNCEIYNNIVYDAFVSISMAPVVGPLYVYRNIFISDKVIKYDKPNNETLNPFAMKFNHGMSPDASKIYFYHNTVFSQGKVYNGPYEDQKLSNCNFYNNIFYSDGTYPTYILERSGLKSDGIDYNGNLYYIDVEQGTQYYFKYYNSYSLDTRYYSLEEALAGNAKGTGWETDGISGEDPLFTDLEASPIKDFTLQKKSPAIDAAVVLPNDYPTIIKKCGEKFDIGAYEYTGNDDCDDDDDDDDTDTASSASKNFFGLILFVFFLLIFC
ncbi:f-box only protein [Anaeramoeba flamelloides]|uniref:F-box only protein n=1 Tax=Anaeramoeba flamelloides TaxID=1746091 RepID=A0AAV7ZBT3_9EUKA|nr:f-box only protein [Anaeramoeba flamelloides]